MKDIDVLVDLVKSYGENEKHFVYSIVLKQYESLIRDLIKKYKFCRYYDDLYQECCLKTYQVMDSYDITKNSSFITYLSKSLSLCIYRKLRYEQLIRVPEYIKADEYNIEFIDPIVKGKDDGERFVFELIPFQTEETNNIDLRLQLSSALKLLTKDELLLCNYLYNGYSITEIANIYKLNYNTITNRIKKIKDKLINHGISL